ncbi:MAG: Gfo/Idh/MocA family oxidoreductase, partial [Candidatus Hydrogenedentes bacterium]|nr:Gfo/Idh/MocA family oxidoreductase [Candidatus Hydrogenedentota bacterium]
MTNKKQISRRTFLKRSQVALAAATAPMILPSGVLAAPGRPGANDRIQVGYIGCGRRANSLFGLPEEGQLVALSDLYRSRLEEVGKRFKGAALYDDYRELLASDKIDAVVIATPDHWHAKPAIDACRAGKDIYCEKPLTLTIDEGKQMVKAVRENNRIAQTGSQQRTMISCNEGIQRILKGELGEIQTVHTANLPSPWECELGGEPVPEGLKWDTWCGQAEPRAYHPQLFSPRGAGKRYEDGRPYGWISYTPFSGGEMTGWGAHGLDMIQWALGMSQSGPVEVWPEPVESGPLSFQGTPLKGDNPWPEAAKLACPVVFRYANGITGHMDGKGHAGGGLFIGSEGTMNITRGVYEMKRNGEKEKTRVTEPKGRPDTREHLKNWLQCIHTRETPNAEMEIGHRSTTVCHLGNIARWTGRKLTWDPAKEEFVNDLEANRYLKRAQRAG